MKDLTNKISYIQGLADGLSLASKSDEGKVVTELIEVVKELCCKVCDNEKYMDNLSESIDELDDVLVELADEIEELQDDMSESSYLDYDDDELSFAPDSDFFDDDDDDSELFEMECPECHEDIMIDYDMLDENNCIVCTNCGQTIELNIDFNDEEDE